LEKLNPLFPANTLPPYPLGKLTQSVRLAREQGRDVIDFSHVNPSLGAPSFAIDALVESSLKNYNHSYSSSQGISSLREAGSQWYKTRFGVEVCPKKELVVTFGAKEAIAHLLLATVGARDTVIVPTPSYPIHTAAVYIAGAGFIGVPLPKGKGVLSSNSSFFDELEAVFNRTWPRPSSFILSFPHNPTTALVTECFFKRIIDFAKKNSVYVVHDFAYADICFDSYKAPSILSIPGAFEVAVETYSLSKGLNLAGWRVGFCVGNPELISALKRIKSYLDFGIFQPIQIAATKILTEHQKEVLTELEQVQSTYHARQSALAIGLADLGWEFEMPKSTLFLWAKLPKAFLEKGAEVYTKELLEACDVAACPGSGFDIHSDEYVRFALMENETRTRTALKRISKNNISI